MMTPQRCLRRPQCPAGLTVLRSFACCFLLPTNTTVSLAAASFRAQPAHSQSPATRAQSGSARFENIKFKVTKIGDGKSDDGTWWKVFYLSASDGHQVYKFNRPFSSVQRANKELQLCVHNAEKIIRRERELDDQKNVVGERVLALYTRNEAGKPYYKVFWRTGAGFNEIIGEHLDDVLALEDRIKGNPSPDISKEF